MRSAAYNMRGVLISERTGESYRYPDVASTLMHHEVLLPTGAASFLADPGRLWNLAEAAERRKDACVARELVIALPSNPEISHDDRVAMVKEFAHEHFVSKGLPVQINIHRPHGTGNSATVNYHAHLLIAVRRLDAAGFSARKALDLAPQIKTIGGRRVVTEAESWGSEWRDYQDAWFRRHGKGIAVDPVAPFPNKHLGPKRFRHPLDPRLEEARRIKALNTVTLTALDRVPSGWRDLEITDVAKELSPVYADLLGKRAKLQELVAKADALLKRGKKTISEGDRLLAERWRELGIARRGLHATGAYPDLRIGALEAYRRKGERAVERWAIRGSAWRGQLAVVSRRAVVEFDKIRPDAEKELRRRQKIARQARETLVQTTANTLHKHLSWRRGAP